MNKPKKNIRVIPRLDIKGPNLVKGINLEGLRVLGKPENFAKLYYNSGADELMFVDVVASLYERNSLHQIIKKTAKEIFIPLTVAGGIRSIEDIREVLRVGADKVSLNTAAINNPGIIKEASRTFGSSTIVITIEAIRDNTGKYLAYTDNGREFTGIEVVDWAREVEKLGAGEIVITSVDQEGIGQGFDIELTRDVSNSVNIPVIAHGGAGGLDHIVSAVTDGAADAVAISSMFHYGILDNHDIKSSCREEGNNEFLKSGKMFSKIFKCNPAEIKTYLIANGLLCRN